MIASDGAFFAARPADATGLWFGRTDANQLMVYRNNGSNDHLLGVADGDAVLAGNRLTAVNLADGSPRFSTALPVGEARDQHELPRGALDANHIFVAFDTYCAVFDRTNGQQLSASGTLNQQFAVNAQRERYQFCAGFLLSQQAINGQLNIVGFGPVNLAEQLYAKITAEPDNPLHYVRLASLYQAKQNDIATIETLMLALARGANSEHAERVAELVRRRLRLYRGHEQFQTEIARLADLKIFIDDIDGEIAWWRSRDATVRGDQAAAQQFQAEITQYPDRLLTFGDFSVSLHVLAGMQDWQASARQATRLATKEGTAGDVDWQLPEVQLGPIISHGRQVFVFRQGWLQGIDVHSGEVTWEAPAGDYVRALVGLQGAEQFKPTK